MPDGPEEENTSLCAWILMKSSSPPSGADITVLIHLQTMFKGSVPALKAIHTSSGSGDRRWLVRTLQALTVIFGKYGSTMLRTKIDHTMQRARNRARDRLAVNISDQSQDSGAEPALRRCS